MPRGIYKRTDETRKKMSESHKGLKLTDVTKKKLSKINTGKKLSAKTKQKVSRNHVGMRGRKHSLKTRQKMSKYTGDARWNYRDGITILNKRIYHSYKYRQWRSDVFTRNGFICQRCGKKGDIEAHHKKEFSKIISENKIATLEKALNCEELWNINNGITLCKKCHNLTKRGNPKFWRPK